MDIAKAQEILEGLTDELEPYTKGGFEPAGTAVQKADHYRILLNIVNRRVVDARTALGWHE